jgi:GDP-4-dehydro-6-deoxy-D-mannose reductase
MMRVLVTGAQGFLGRYVVSGWLRRPDVEVLGIGRSDRVDEAFTFDLRWNGALVPAPLPPTLRLMTTNERYSYEQADACDTEHIVGVLRDFRPHLIVHGAAALRDDPWEALFRSNVQSVLSITEAVVAADRPFPRLVLVSSGSVYGRVAPTTLPTREESPCLPLDLYGVSKLAAENIARIASLEHGLPLVRARIFNLVGPGLQDRHLAASLAGQIAAIKHGDAPAAVAVGSLDSTRDFIDVRDASAALMILAERATPGPHAAFNVASGRETRTQTLYEMLVRLAEVGVVDVMATHGRWRTLDVPRTWADIGPLRALGFELGFEMAQSLLDMLRYYETSVAAA